MHVNGEHVSHALTAQYLVVTVRCANLCRKIEKTYDAAPGSG